MSRHRDTYDGSTGDPKTGVFIELPPAMADHSVAQLVEVLQAITTAVENRYADQLCRYYCDPPDELQYPLWDNDPIDEDDLPF